jgi:DNA-binding transcriptional LysR family regulator
VELRQIEYFAAVARTGGIRRAAAELAVNPSALSQQVRLLERELGVRLLERVGQRVVLTDAGRRFQEGTRHALQELWAMRQEMIDFAKFDGGELVLGTLPGRGSFWLAGFLEALAVAYPQLSIRLVERPSARLIGMLETGELHLAWFTVPETFPQLPPELSFRLVGESALSAVVSTDHQFAEMAEIPVARLVGHPLLVPSKGETPRRLIEQAYHALGARPTVRIEADDPVTLIRLAGKGLGIGVVFSQPRTYHESVVIRIGPPPLKGGFGVAWSLQRGAHVRALTNFVEFFEHWWRTRTPPMYAIH